MKLRYLAAGLIGIVVLLTLVLYPWSTPEPSKPDETELARTEKSRAEVPLQQRIVPAGLRSMKHSDADGYENYAEYIWYDHAVAVVEADSDMVNDHCWTPNRVESGDNSVVYLEWGGHHPETTGGGYTIVQIQLSKTVAQGDTIKLSTPKKERQTLAEKSWLGRDLSKLKPNEISVFNFSNPIGESLSSDGESFNGSISILKIDDDFITIKLEIKDLEDFDIDGEPRVFTLERKMGSNAE